MDYLGSATQRKLVPVTKAPAPAVAKKKPVASTTTLLPKKQVVINPAPVKKVAPKVVMPAGLASIVAQQPAVPQVVSKPTVKVNNDVAIVDAAVKKYGSIEGAIANKAVHPGNATVQSMMKTQPTKEVAVATPTVSIPQESVNNFDLAKWNANAQSVPTQQVVVPAQSVSGLSNGWSADGGDSYEGEMSDASQAYLEKQWKAEEAMNRAGLAQELANGKFARQTNKQNYL